MSPPAAIALVLHAHLPWVRHPEHADPLEERWLHEAVAECYLPLLDVLDAWTRDAVPFRLALSLSPTLLAMLDDPLLRERIGRRLEALVELGRRETRRARGTPFERAVLAHAARFEAADRRWRIARGDLPTAFAEFRAAGLELFTSSATHAFLPLLSSDPPSVRAQIAVGARALRRLGGRASADDAPGFWSPECGYFPGLEADVTRAGFGHLFLDAHGLVGGEPPPRRGVFAPCRMPAGGFAFARDPVASREVWDARSGYPGDGRYREFHRDIGFDLPFEQVAPWIHESGLRIATGFKLHRVTGRDVPLGEKAPYDPDEAARAVAEHAGRFVRRRMATARELAGLLDRPPLFVAPFDAELFGHWWFEGPAWLDATMRRIAATEGVRAVAPREALRELDPGAIQTVAPIYSSWGEGGFADVWLDASCEWIWRELDACSRAFRAAAGRHAGTADPLARRALDQAARELLLAQASDWPFMIRMRTTPEYAEHRVREHLAATRDLCRGIDAAIASGPRSDAATDLAARTTAREAAHPIFADLRFEESMKSGPGANV